MTHINHALTARFRRGAVYALAIALATPLAACGAGSSSVAQSGSHTASAATVNVGTKNFAEEYLVSDMYQLLLQKAGFAVKMHTLSTTPLLQNALVHGDIDLYPEYTGTGLQVLGINKIYTNPIQTYDIVKSQYQKRYHVTWLEQAPMNDTNDVAVTQATATKYHLHTLSDLARVANQFTFAALAECKNRPDCLGGMQSRYGIHFKHVIYIESTPLRYSALKSGQANAVEVFTTDAPIEADHLVVLKDNKHAVFPADHIAPVVRDSILAKYPTIKSALNTLAPALTTQVLIRLNGQVILQSKDPMSVARSFLLSKHLL